MNVSLTPQLEAMIAQKVKRGMYQTASEVVRDGLRLMKERDDAQLRALRADIQAGSAEIEKGNYIELADEAAQKKFFDNIKSRGRKRLAAESRRKAK